MSNSSRLRTKDNVPRAVVGETPLLGDDTALEPHAARDVGANKGQGGGAKI